MNPNENPKEKKIQESKPISLSLSYLIESAICRERRGGSAGGELGLWRAPINRMPGEEQRHQAENIFIIIYNGRISSPHTPTLRCCLAARESPSLQTAGQRPAQWSLVQRLHLKPKRSKLHKNGKKKRKGTTKSLPMNGPAQWDGDE